jgi:hypothetical protein
VGIGSAGSNERRDWILPLQGNIGDLETFVHLFIRHLNRNSARQKVFWSDAYKMYSPSKE